MAAQDRIKRVHGSYADTLRSLLDGTVADSRASEPLRALAVSSLSLKPSFCAPRQRDQSAGKDYTRRHQRHPKQEIHHFQRRPRAMLERASVCVTMQHILPEACSKVVEALTKLFAPSFSLQPAVAPHAQAAPTYANSPPQNLIPTDLYFTSFAELWTIPHRTKTSHTSQQNPGACKIRVARSL